MYKLLDKISAGMANLVWFKAPDEVPEDMKGKEYLIAYHTYSFSGELVKDVGIGYYSDYCNDGWVVNGQSVKVIAVASVPEFPKTFQDFPTTCGINS